ncbi:MAG TPA: hypothetical protein VKB03_10450 [Conexibacter sp.]|nr:hypothetical protein [Conexibacter sp.]
MRHRRALLAGIATCTVMLSASAAAAETLTYTTPGTTTAMLPVGVVSLHVVAVGGRGGGLAGGYGAVVAADVRADRGTAAGGPSEIHVTVAGNGAIGVAGAGGGGAAGFLPFPTLAGGGGGASSVEACGMIRVNDACLFTRQIVAGGGGGAGADGLPGRGGAGGSAGSTPAPGGVGSSTATQTAAGAGAGATTTGGAGGSGSVSSDPACEGGEAGASGTFQTGGAGGLSADLAGHGDAGGGGGGTVGGGGGGGGAYCGDDTGTSGGGGGAGASRAPTNGQISTDTTGQPSVTITYEMGHPSVTILAPREGAVYVQGSRDLVTYRCRPFSISAPIVSCAGPVRSGAVIDTTTLGDNAFTVTARDSLGFTFASTVTYRVVDQTRPRIARLRIVPRRIDLSSDEPSTTVRFRLSEPASVSIVLHRVRMAAASRARARVVSGVLGRNSFVLRARLGGRPLRVGAYRLSLVAVDPSGNRSRPVTRRFRVVDSDA